MKKNPMLILKHAMALAMVGLVAQFSGCSGGDSTAELTDQLATLKTATAHFETLLTQVVDEASAKTLMPELNIALGEMFTAMEAVQKIEKSNSRTNVVLRNEIEEFQANGSAVIVQELERLKRIPGVPKAIDSLLKQLQ